MGLAVHLVEKVQMWDLVEKVHGVGVHRVWPCRVPLKMTLAMAKAASTVCHRAGWGRGG